MRHFKTTPTAAFIFYRSYSRWSQNARESWDDMVARCVLGLAELGKLNQEEVELLYDEFENCSSLPSGRYMWCGGTDWSSKQQNYPGQYNCSSTVVDNIATFGYLMDLAAMGCGTGAVLELENIAKLPPIKTKLNIELAGKIGTLAPEDRQENTLARFDGNTVDLHIGDSRRGWVESYVGLIQLAVLDVPGGELTIRVDLSSIRPAGEKLAGFGGTANPSKLPELYSKVAAILNGTIGRQMNSIECCKLIDEAAMVIVAGNIRRSAGIRQFSADDQLAITAKDDLWQQDEDGKWRIDPERDALRMSNHTRVFHIKPTLNECIDSVRKQYYSGEGAIQWAGEAVARANADLLDTPDKKAVFLGLYNGNRELAKDWLNKLGGDEDESVLDHRMARYGLNPCLVADTLVVTYEGYQRIADLVGKLVTIWDGQCWRKIDNFRVTGENQPIYRVRLKSGYKIEATPYHSFILEDYSRKKLSELAIGDRLMQHSQVPDGERMRVRDSDDWNEIVDIEYSHVADKVYCCTVPKTHAFALANGILIGQCGEIIGGPEFMCNLAEVHLNTIDPFDLDAQTSAFRAASLSVAALLHHQFEIPRFQRSRELDPIVGVSFTGLFDFFVHLFGIEWLCWWQAGRPANYGDPVDIDDDCRMLPLLECDFIRVHHFDSLSDLFLAIEEEYLESWKAIVFDVVTEYCERHGLKTPNRCTTVQPSGSKSLLTGASPGWHPPKASRYIRRMTFGKGEPIALAAIDMGYNVIPSQSDKDENGNLLNDIHDPRVTEWLVEIPCATSWADMPGVDEIDISQFSALAQFDFYMHVQRHYSTHTTSATIELREDEIEPLATAIYEDIQKDGGYMSAALLARFDSLETFPRLPFEPIDKDRYQQELVNIRMRRIVDNFDEALAAHDHGQTAESGPSGCDSDRCLIGDVQK